MRQLWAPWRMIYIDQVDKRRCFLCRALREKKDRKNLILTRNEKCFVIMNKYPYNSGHLLIAPLAHKGTLEALKDEELLGLFSLTRDMKRLLERTMKPVGFNIGINLGRVAGAGLISHIHIHIVPRWRGDTNFMPIFSHTKVLSQALTKLYDRLKKAL